tara:strand:+ start:3766 stop:4356 length:591 start_codon:yes stop_codon:yes gene_type:complete
MEIITPFRYIFGSEIINEDLSELKTNNLFVNGRDQEEKTYDTNPFLILNEYKYSKKVLTNHFNKFIKEVFNYECQFKMTTSWMTKIGIGERVHHHNHLNSMWSCVFYFDEYTEKSCPLKFMNPLRKESPLWIEEEGMKENPMNGDCQVQPKHNLLIIFPSWIYHYSDPNQEKERKSLAFNFMPTGNIGMADSQLIL